MAGEERKNRYLGWSLDRLRKHHEQIEGAIKTAEERILQSRYSVNGGYDPEEFIELHSLSECRVRKIVVREEDIGTHADGRRFLIRYFARECSTHGVRSTETYDFI